jgi:hypothetical protein
MSKVQLKINMIFDGAFYPRGVVMDDQKLPPNLRRQKYLGEPGSVEPLYSPEEESTSGGLADEQEGIS